MKNRFNWADLFMAAAAITLTVAFTKIMNGAPMWHVALCAVFLAIYLTLWHNQKTGTYREHQKAMGCVDIWALQKNVMRMSGQKLPALPEINKHVLMYYALILEEAGETGEAIVSALTGGRNNTATMEDFERMSRILDAIQMAQTNMRYQSTKIRDLLKEVPNEWIAVPSLHLFKGILDGAEDVAVVTAGFSLAAGLPGREGFVNVNSSNASKANPNTGLIDKTPDGKWIKGVNYVEPNLLAVLEEHTRKFREVVEDNGRFAHKTSYES